MKNKTSSCIPLFLLLCFCVSAFVVPKFVLADTDWIPENTTGETNKLGLSTRKDDAGTRFSYCTNLQFGQDPCPPATFSYDKIEGDWWVYVQQGSGNGSAVERVSKRFIHDLTPPICRLTDSIGGTTDITEQPGLNGQWANEPILVYPDCTDRIRGNLFNPRFCETINVRARTLHHNRGLGSTPLQVRDRAGNIGTCSLPRPPLVDTQPPLLQSLTIEHTALGLPEEQVSLQRGIPNEYRADDGDVKLYLSMRDSSDTDRSRSGISGLSFASDTSDDKSDTFSKLILTQLENQDGPIIPTDQKTIEITDIQPLGSDRYVADINVLFDITDTYPALSQVGLYEIKGVIEDKAQNSIDIPNRYIRIHPSIVNEEKSQFSNKISLLSASESFDSANCIEQSNKDQSLYANAIHACEIQYQLFDAYENKLSRRTVEQIGVVGQNTNGTYSLLVDENQAFTNGLRLSDNTNQILNDDAQSSFETKALLPTVLLETSPLVERARNMKVDPKTVVFDIDVRSVDKRGKETALSDTIGLSTDVVFLPWLRTSLITDSEKVMIQEQQDYTVLLSTTNTDIIPVPCDVNVYGYPPSGTEFANVAFDKTNPIAIRYTQGGVTNATDQFSTVLVASQNGGKITPGALILVSDLSCSLEGKTITYPGGILGGDLFDDCRNCGEGVELEPFAIQADIEGSVLGVVSYTDLKDSDEHVQEIGVVNQKDIREDITRNAIAMIRSREPLNALSDTEISLSNIEFGPNEIRYYRGVDVILSGGSVAGVGTLVVEDGNIIIEDDIWYRDAKSSLGVIVLNTDQTPYETTGNLYIKRDVGAFVGTYFTDGAVLSYISTPDDLRIYIKADEYVSLLTDLPVLVNSRTDDTLAFSDNPLAKQLVLDGTLLSRNTLGGDNFNPRYTPWEETNDADLSRLYDLHYVRRYTPHRVVEYQDADGNVTSKENIVLRDTDNKYCRKVRGKCDRNTNAFVIRTDRKVTTLPPPGFKVKGSIGR